MKIFDKEVHLELDALISVETTPRSLEPNFRIDLRMYGFSVLLMKRGVDRPFWAIQVESAGRPDSLMRGWWDEEVVVKLAHDLHILIDRERVIVSHEPLLPVIRTGLFCEDCGRETAYLYSDNSGRENINYGVDFQSHHCPHCGAVDYIPGFEPRTQEPEVPEIPELEYAPETLELREEY